MSQVNEIQSLLNRIYSELPCSISHHHVGGEERMGEARVWEGLPCIPGMVRRRDDGSGEDSSVTSGFRCHLL